LFGPPEGVILGLLGSRSPAKIPDLLSGGPGPWTARNGDDDSGLEIDPPDHVIFRVGNVEVAGTIQRDVPRLVQGSGDGRSAVPGMRWLTSSSHRADCSGLRGQ